MVETVNDFTVKLGKDHTSLLSQGVCYRAVKTQYVSGAEPDGEQFMHWKHVRFLTTPETLD